MRKADNLLLSCADYLGVWEPQPPGILRAYTRLLYCLYIFLANWDVTHLSQSRSNPSAFLLPTDDNTRCHNHKSDNHNTNSNKNLVISTVWTEWPDQYGLVVSAVRMQGSTHINPVISKIWTSVISIIWIQWSAKYELSDQHNMNFSDQHNTNSEISEIWTQWSAQYELRNQHNMNSEISEIGAQWSAKYELRDQRNVNSVIRKIWTQW